MCRVVPCFFFNSNAINFDETARAHRAHHTGHVDVSNMYRKTREIPLLFHCPVNPAGVFNEKSVYGVVGRPAINR